MNLSTQTNDEPLGIPAGLLADRPGNNSRLSPARSPSSNASADPHARIFGLSLAALLAACLVLNAASPSTRVCQQSDRDFGTTGTDLSICLKSRRSCAGRRFARGAIRNDPFQGVRNERGRRGARQLMKAAVVSLPLRNWLLKKPDWLDHQTAVGLTFAVKTFAASLLALYIAFWAGLDDPRWSFLTVFVVSQPDSGLVLAKSFYRILGTIAGVLVTIALVFGLAQYGELFVAAVAVWMCLCNFAARAVRNFASYGFQLAGYTVAIVAIPAALEPSGAYPLVVARCTEIALGIICAALVSRLILVRELSPKLVELVRALTRRADSFATLLLDPDADRERVAAERTELAQAYLDVQAMQRSAYFESADARVLDQPLRRLTQAALELCAMAEAAASHRVGTPPYLEKNASPGNGISRTSEWSAEDGPIVSALVRAADERDLGLARSRLRESHGSLRPG